MAKQADKIGGAPTSVADQEDAAGAAAATAPAPSTRLALSVDDELEEILGVLREARSQEKEKWFACPHCKKGSMMRYPDHGAQAKAVELWLRIQDKRTAKEASPLMTDVQVRDFVRARLAEMSDEDFASLMATG